MFGTDAASTAAAKLAALDTNKDGFVSSADSGRAEAFTELKGRILAQSGANDNKQPFDSVIDRKMNAL